MKLNGQKGYSLIEIGVGLIMITIFAVASFTMFNGSYNNYRSVEQRNIAMRYAIEYVEKALALPIENVSYSNAYANGANLKIVLYDEDDEALSTPVEKQVGIYLPMGMSELESITSLDVPSEEELLEGKYAVPADLVMGPTTIAVVDELTGEEAEVTNTTNMIITVKVRRLPAKKVGAVYKLFDERILKIIVDVEYKIKPGDTEYQKFTLESLKIS